MYLTLYLATSYFEKVWSTISNATYCIRPYQGRRLNSRLTFMSIKGAVGTLKSCYLNVIWYKWHIPLSPLVGEMCWENICFELIAHDSQRANFDFWTAPGKCLPNQGISPIWCKKRTT